MRVYDLYSLLDKDDVVNDSSLAFKMKHEQAVGDYSGPWALETMGNAGGQTIGGVLSTATHGGDVNYGPLADSVVAVHLVDADER